MTPHEVAVTILSQIRVLPVKGCQNGTHAMMCWDFRNPMHGAQNGNPGLVFQVNGLSHKGKVFVTLNSSDLYDIHTYKTRSKDTEWTLARSNVFVEDLAQFLDDIIEGGK